MRSFLRFIIDRLIKDELAGLCLGVALATRMDTYPHTARYGEHITHALIALFYVRRGVDYIKAASAQTESLCDKLRYYHFFLKIIYGVVVLRTLH